MQKSTYTSQELERNAEAVRKASERGAVFITSGGRIESVLLCYGEYCRLKGGKRNLMDALSMPGLEQIADDFDAELGFKLKGTVRAVDFD